MRVLKDLCKWLKTLKPFKTDFVEDPRFPIGHEEPDCDIDEPEIEKAVFEINGDEQEKRLLELNDKFTDNTITEAEEKEYWVLMVGEDHAEFARAISNGELPDKDENGNDIIY